MIVVIVAQLYDYIRNYTNFKRLIVWYVNLVSIKFAATYQDRQQAPFLVANTLHSQYWTRVHIISLPLASSHIQFQGSHLSTLLAMGKKFGSGLPKRPNLNRPSLSPQTERHFLSRYHHFDYHDYCSSPPSQPLSQPISQLLAQPISWAKAASILHLLCCL